MLNRFIAGVFAAALVPVAITTTGRAQSDAGAAAASQAGETLEIAGCVVRAADYARATGSSPAAVGADGSSPQFVLLTGGLDAPAYSVTGTREQELGSHVGERVSVSGTVEQVRAQATQGRAGVASDPARGGRVVDGLPPSGSNGVTPAGSPAHEAGDALPRTVPTTGSAADVDADGPTPLPRLNAAAFRPAEGACAELPRVGAAPARTEATSSAAPAARAATAPAAPAPPVTVAGCLVRLTPAGTAVSPSGGADEFMLTRAAIVSDRKPAGPSAVPGSAPSGSGTGTVPSPGGAAQGSANPIEERSYALSLRSAGDRAALAKYIGQQVEIVGAVARGEDEAASAGAAAARGAEANAAGARGRVEAPPAVAHSSAPAGRITVTSFQAIGGTCN